MDPVIVDRFWSKVKKSDTCWTWTAYCGYGSYGIFWGGTTIKRITAHRFAWTITHGPIPAGMMVLHLCDNPPCVRPDHLVLGDQSLNMQHRTQRGRVVTSQTPWFCHTCNKKITDQQNGQHAILWKHSTQKFEQPKDSHQ